MKVYKEQPFEASALARGGVTSLCPDPTGLTQPVGLYLQEHSLSPLILSLTVLAKLPEEMGSHAHPSPASPLGRALRVWRTAAPAVYGRAFGMRPRAFSLVHQPCVGRGGLRRSFSYVFKSEDAEGKEILSELTYCWSPPGLLIT